MKIFFKFCGLLRKHELYLKIVTAFYLNEVKCTEVKFVFSKKATKFDKIFTVNLTLTTYCQIDGEDFVNFCDLLRKHELYIPHQKRFFGIFFDDGMEAVIGSLFIIDESCLAGFY